MSIAVVLLLFFAQCGKDKGLVNGVKVPDIQLNNPDGELLPLSSIENKYVFIYFWASWCRPCRQSHPYIAEVYEKFKNAKIGDADGFTIYSVSMDTDKKSWMKAIEKDELPWAYQVSDLKGFGSEYVDLYQFEQIPTTYLIDPNGVIIGKNISLKWMEFELKRRMEVSE